MLYLIYTYIYPSRYTSFLCSRINGNTVNNARANTMFIEGVTPTCNDYKIPFMKHKFIIRLCLMYFINMFTNKIKNKIGTFNVTVNFKYLLYFIITIILKLKFGVLKIYKYIYISFKLLIIISVLYH